MANSSDVTADFVSRAQTLPEAIGGVLDHFGGILRCGTCGTTAPLGNPGERITRTGWPSCCGYTMTWWTQRQIDAGEMPS